MTPRRCGPGQPRGNSPRRNPWGHSGLHVLRQRRPLMLASSKWELFVAPVAKRDHVMKSLLADCAGG